MDARNFSDHEENPFGIGIMSIRELRKILFEITEQEMTIRKLRNLLFNVSNQDEEMTIQELRNLLFDLSDSDC